MVALVGGVGPRVVLAMPFVTTALLGLFISNIATKVLMAPVVLADYHRRGLCGADGCATRV
jgi:di/tricarboxylate transporter